VIKSGSGVPEFHEYVNGGEPPLKVISEILPSVAPYSETLEMTPPAVMVRSIVVRDVEEEITVYSPPEFLARTQR
jgi:hypothetical protein